MGSRNRLALVAAILFISLYSLNRCRVGKPGIPSPFEMEVISQEGSVDPSKSLSNVNHDPEVIMSKPVHLASDTEAADPSLVGIDSEKLTLTLNISGLKNQESKLHIALFKTANGFPQGDRSWKTEVISVSDITVSHQSVCEKVERLAVAVFQDLDGNGTLSKGNYGIPSEPYGFSNNARGLMGPPTFKQAEIPINHAEEVLEIRLK